MTTEREPLFWYRLAAAHEYGHPPFISMRPCEGMTPVYAALAQPAPQYASPEDYARRNPLGGVARVFEIIADRLRQGEDYDYVLWDYGLQRAQPAQPVAWQPCGRTLRVLARAFRKVAPHLIDEFINRAQEALLQEQDDDNQGNGGRTRGMAGKGDADHAGPAGQRNDEQHDDGAAERGAGLLRLLAHEDCGGGNAARVTEEGAVDAAPQPAPAAEWTQEQIDAIHKDADKIGSKARTPRLAPAAEQSTATKDR